MSSQSLTGIGVGSAAVVGKCLRFAAPPTAPADEPGPQDDAAKDAAAAKVSAALDSVAADLKQAASEHEGKTLGAVLGAAAEMALDPDLKARTVQTVRSGVGAATAVTQVTAEYGEMFAQLGGYMAERVSDLNSVRDRAIAKILGVELPKLSESDEASVIVAKELTPADTSGLDMDKVLALVTEEGGPTSHTAIIARQLGLPCVVRVAGVTEVAEGSLLAVDSARGVVTVDPDQAVQDEITQRMERRAQLLADEAPGATSDGHPIQLLANIGTAADAENAAATAVEGVGLFRTEVMFLDTTTEPSVELQTEQYTKVLRAFAGRKVVVRTLDAGSDKPLPYANTEPEENPALGIRAYRLVRTFPQLLDNQLTALAQAIKAVPETDTWVMAPMISTQAEAATFYAKAKAAGLPKAGIMVEVPAVALRGEQVIDKVDFASIGTNDLAQYTMATDRQLGALADLIDRWQPAVLQLVAQTAAAGAKLGKPVGVCGESASDPLMALVLCGLGINSLSMSASAVPEVRYALRNTTFAQCQQMAEAALAAPDAQAAVTAVTLLLSAEVRAAILVD